jgi:hypothetical protein
MRSKTILGINFILSFVIFLMFLPVFEGYLVGVMFSGWILLLAFVVLIFLFLSLAYSLQIIFIYKVFRTAGFFHRILLIWPFIQLLIWGFFLIPF